MTNNSHPSAGEGKILTGSQDPSLSPKPADQNPSAQDILEKVRELLRNWNNRDMFDSSGKAFQPIIEAFPEIATAFEAQAKRIEELEGEINRIMEHWHDTGKLVEFGQTTRTSKLKAEKDKLYTDASLMFEALKEMNEQGCSNKSECEGGCGGCRAKEILPQVQSYPSLKNEGQKLYPEWTCEPCGIKHGRGMPENHLATWHTGKCDVCGKETDVTEPRDFGHFPNWNR